MGGYYLLKSYGGDSGNRIFVLYWRCPLIRMSVIRGSTVCRKIINREREKVFEIHINWNSGRFVFVLEYTGNEQGISFVPLR
jgi:hypothetical protein